MSLLRKLCTRVCLLITIIASLLFPSATSAYYFGSEWQREMHAPSLEEGEQVTQWLLLLIDASASMARTFESLPFFELQMRATARGLLDPCVVWRLIDDPANRSAIGVVMWSSTDQQEVLVNWTVIRSEDDIARIGRRLIASGNSLASNTAVSAAINFAIGKMQAPFMLPNARRIIDISSNGFDNEGGNPRGAAERANALGITINAIVMPEPGDPVERIRQYYEREVVTRDGFVVAVEREGDTLVSLATATATKMCQEIAMLQ